MTTMLRRSDAKVVVWHGNPDTGTAQTGELYDLNADPRELVNLWDDPEHAQLRADMCAAVLDLQMWHEDRTAARVAPW
ncbi:sulfatase/phosphatase domain-containing protein [Pseudactinotalea terrae]|uniref:sulfatase/phosphatase domain-containing protein n=1 Tax=Pseudactinotalea terrae TaxID=1743262 RepID=UPI0012E23EE2|nr:sulfatase/phosphatase domain-containing protein [Pseudactinotalea terrae]